MRSSKIFAVAWREFRYTVLRPVFIIAILGIPLLIIGIGAVAGVIFATHKEPPLVGSIAIVEASGELADAASIEFDPKQISSDDVRAARDAADRAREFTNATGNVVPDTSGMPMQRGEVRIEIVKETDSSQAAIDSLKERIRAGDLLAVAVVPPEVLDVPTPSDVEAEQPSPPPTFQFFIADGIDSDNVELMESRLGQAVVRVRAERAGLDPRQALAMLKRPEPETRRLDEAGGEAETDTIAQTIRREMLPMVFMMLIWIGVLSSAQHLMLSTIEEKSNRVMEVLLSAVSPFQLMTGKILGYGAVGLLIVGIYSALGVGAIVFFSTFGEFLTWLDLVLFGIFYLLAYFMIAAMMAAVGSAVTDIREANTLVTPVMLILMVPLMLWLPISQDPNGPVATAFSFIPPAIPFAMILRHVAEEPVPTWEYPATILWGTVCAIGMVWLAAKIFRVGVLMYGKPPSLIELVKWARYS